jgi:hypothetical protein
MIESPFDILPNKSLLITVDQNVTKNNHYHQQKTPIIKQPSSSPQINQKHLEDIANYINHRRTVRASKKQRQSQHKSISTEIQRKEHKPTYYLPSSSSSSKESKSPDIMDFWNNITSTFGIEQKVKPSDINRDFLCQERVTIKKLITKCKVPISELYNAHITRTFDDLVSLGFRVRDLTLDREKLKADIFVSLFNTHYDIIRERIGFTIADLIQAQFTCAELETLKFTFAPMIENGGIGKDHLKTLNFSLNDLIKRGLKRSHILRLKITEKEALLSLDYGGFGWDAHEFQMLMNIEEGEDQ